MAKQLTAKKLQALELIASGMTDVAIAKQIGVTNVSISRWRKEPLFAAELTGFLSKQRERIEAKLAILAEDSASILQKVLVNAKVKDPRDGLEATRQILGTYARIIARHDKQQVEISGNIAPLFTIIGKGPDEGLDE